MKIIIAIVELIFLIASSFVPNLPDKAISMLSYPANYQELGIPLLETYPNDPHSRCPWDIEVYNDKVFIGGGDYDKNTGPVPVYYFDITENQWNYSGKVPDEQIDKFAFINQSLTIPGCDPRDSWDYGNLYQYQNENWKVNRSIPGGIHQFDVIEYEDRIFVGLGVIPGEFPIAVSKDHGKSFQQVTMYKDDKVLDTSIPDDGSVTSVQIRVYDFFQFDGMLFAYYCYYTNQGSVLELYQYRDDAFYYYCDLPDNIRTKTITYRSFLAKAEYRDCAYFTTGNLYYTKNMRSAEKIDISDKCIVSDLRIIFDKLYILVTAPDENGHYRSSVWVKTNSSDTSFMELFYFHFPCPALSFTYQNGSFYFGMGHGARLDGCEDCGSVLSVNWQLKQ